jgi:hypothetical protein
MKEARSESFWERCCSVYVHLGNFDGVSIYGFAAGFQFTAGSGTIEGNDAARKEKLAREGKRERS